MRTAALLLLLIVGATHGEEYCERFKTMAACLRQRNSELTGCLCSFCASSEQCVESGSTDCDDGFLLPCTIDLDLPPFTQIFLYVLGAVGLLVVLSAAVHVAGKRRERRHRADAREIRRRRGFAESPASFH